MLKKSLTNTLPRLTAVETGQEWEVVISNILWGPEARRQPPLACPRASFPIRHLSPMWLCWFTSWPPYTEAKERLEKEAGCSRLVGGRFRKQENLQVRLVLAPKRDLCIFLPEFENCSRELNEVQSHILSTWSQQSLKTAPAVGIVVGLAFQGQGRG